MKTIRILIATGLILTLGVIAEVRAEILAADDFLYKQPTKEFGPGGGFNLQDYGGGQNGAIGEWTGRWVSSGNAIIAGEDFMSEDLEQFEVDEALIAGGLIPVTANYLRRGIALDGLPADPTLYFSARLRTGTDDATSLPRFWINAPNGDPLLDDAQMAIGIDDFGAVVVEIGANFEVEEDDPLNDGEFHTLVGKLEVNGNGDNEVLTVWADPTGVEDGLSASVEEDVISSVSDLRSLIQLGRLGEGPVMEWDDVAVGTSWEAVTNLEVPRVTLRVDPNSGAASLVSETGSEFDLNYYEIESASGSLNVDGWNSLQDQGIDGDVWRENNPSGEAVTESRFFGSSSLDSGQSWSLGNLWTPGGAQDLIARVGTNRGLLNLAIVDYSENSLRGDFNGNGVIDADDMNLLSAEARSGANGATFDLNGDGLVNDADRTVWVEASDNANTYIGDSNLDGEFNSTDFVTVFVAGEYEDGIANNSGWDTGDWNGDAEFDSSDFVTAFISGGYEIGPRAAVQAVPEPTTCTLLLLAIGLLFSRRRR